MAPQVLVIDDDLTAQKVMKVFLEKSGYAPIIVGTAKAGLEIALKPDAPGIVVLDWMLPDLDGPLVCKKLREAKPKIRPYIVFLSSKQDKSDIGAALDSGADDYVTKPFNVVEFQARLRVARRTIEYQVDLQKQLSENETLSQRNTLLGELISKQQTAASEAARKAAEAAKETHSPIARFSPNEVKFMLAAAFMELRLALEAVQVDAGGLTVESNTALSWAGMAVKLPGSWFDVVISAGTAETRQLLTRSLGREAKTDSEALTFLAEIARVVAAGFGRMLKTRHGDIESFLMSRALDAASRGGKFPMIADGESFRVSVEGIPLRVLTSRTAGSRRTVANGELRALDILAAPYPPPAVSAVPLFKEGVVLSTRFLEKLRYQVESTQVGGNADIWRPSALAAYFNPDA
ncbi:response regulator transcription factor [Nibricoccus sp. IMCC34717]|uniref:response regulator transcription factor n=1 Tax=Nibricoccus sp. IMCC34717 TaxID=3034021 RepID=UPI00384E7846